MKKVFGIFLVLATLSQAAGEESSRWSAVITLQRIEERKEVEGYWVLGSVWNPYMGLALELRGDGNFRFWFRSDVRMKGEPQYPVSGKYSIEGGVLTLSTSTDIYDTRWLLISHGGRTGLFPLSFVDTIVSRKETPPERMLFRLDEQVAKKSWPIYNEPEKEPNKRPEPLSSPR